MPPARAAASWWWSPSSAGACRGSRRRPGRTCRTGCARRASPPRPSLDPPSFRPRLALVDERSAEQGAARRTACREEHEPGAGSSVGHGELLPLAEQDQLRRPGPTPVRPEGRLPLQDVGEGLELPRHRCAAARRRGARRRRSVPGSRAPRASPRPPGSGRWRRPPAAPGAAPCAGRSPGARRPCGLAVHGRGLDERGIRRRRDREAGGNAPPPRPRQAARPRGTRRGGLFRARPSA